MTIDAETLKAMIAEDELGLLEAPVRSEGMTPDRRLIANFVEIMEFVLENGREPASDTADVGEMKLSFRLEALRTNEVHREQLSVHDELGLLVEPEPPASVEEAVADDAFGLLDTPTDDIFTHRSIPNPSTQPERVAQRRPCEDFDRFEPLFKRCQAELRSGERKLIEFRNQQQIMAETFYVLSGILVYVAEKGERFEEHGRTNARLRCIFENGTEADLLLRSLGSQLYRHGKAITDPAAKTEARIEEQLGQLRGHVYVLRSRSEDPKVAQLPELHKIGYTSRSPEERIEGSDGSETFLRAPVELVASYEMPGTMARGVEGLLHRFFAASRLDVWFERDGIALSEANEWFAVPAAAIEEAIGLIEAESIGSYAWDPDARLIRLRA